MPADLPPEATHRPVRQLRLPRPPTAAVVNPPPGEGS
jgi:hypothetical protein